MATQAQRRESTRSAVVQAAVESLVEGGVSGFTAADVAVRAAVSNGSVFRYFPTLTDLLAATVESVFAGLSEEYVKRYAALSSPVVTPRLLLSLLWDVFDDPAVAAVYEVYAAARTDPKLRSAIEPMIREHVDVIDQLGRSILAEVSDTDPEVITRMVSLAVFAMQGLALSRPVIFDAGDAERLIQTLGEAAEQLIHFRDGSAGA